MVHVLTFWRAHWGVNQTGGASVYRVLPCNPRTRRQQVLFPRVTTTVLNNVLLLLVLLFVVFSHAARKHWLLLSNSCNLPMTHNWHVRVRVVIRQPFAPAGRYAPTIHILLFSYIHTWLGGHIRHVSSFRYRVRPMLGRVRRLLLRLRLLLLLIMRYSVASVLCLVSSYNIVLLLPRRMLPEARIRRVLSSRLAPKGPKRLQLPIQPLNSIAPCVIRADYLRQLALVHLF